MSLDFMPAVAFDLIPNEDADRLLVEWGHWLEECDRPFGKHAFGLAIEGELLAVAVSASTVNGSCGGYPRGEIVELARLCSHPDHRDLTRPALRLWRKVAPVMWGRAYWPCRAVVSYQDAVRHTGNIYRFDGWRRVAETKGSTGGGTWSKKRGKREPRVIWAFDLIGASVKANQATEES